MKLQIGDFHKAVSHKDKVVEKLEMDLVKLQTHHASQELLKNEKISSLETDLSLHARKLEEINHENLMMAQSIKDITKTNVTKENTMESFDLHEQLKVLIKNYSDMMIQKESQKYKVEVLQQQLQAEAMITKNNMRVLDSLLKELDSLKYDTNVSDITTYQTEEDSTTFNGINTLNYGEKN